MPSEPSAMVRLCPGLFRIPSKLRRRARRRRMATLVLLAALLLVVAAPLYMVYKPPSFLIGFFEWRWPDVLWRVHLPATVKSGSSETQKYVALTIDDAPSDQTTEIMRVLRDNGAHATFFVIGAQAAGREDLLSRLVADGHELGNHAMHDEASRSLGDDELAAQITAVRDLIRDVYEDQDRDEPPRYFRPGSGFFSDRMRRLVKGLGYRLVLGSIYPHDPQISSWKINAKHVLSMVRPGGIIICHDRRSWTAPMLRRVLPEMKSRGYKVVTLSELLKLAET